MKKKREVGEGRNRSPLAPSDGRAIWSRTARRPSSPRFCIPRGTSLGLAKAAQKNAITRTMQMITISIGLVKWNEPMLKIGFKSKLFRLGDGKPHPEKMWHPLLPAATADTLPITGQFLSHRCRRPVLFVLLGQGPRSWARSGRSAAGWIGRTGR